jgi:hypothetical protein
MTIANARPRQSFRSVTKKTAERDGAMVGLRETPVQDELPGSGTHLNLIPKIDWARLPRISAGHGTDLSTRAENVLRGLAAELTGDNPPEGRWIPSDLLLQRLNYKHLSTARNCGPRTLAEIINWARARGRIIHRSFPAGKSLSTMWQEAISKFATGEISKAEIAEALERSMRRKNTRIPLALQNILLQLIRSSNG